MSTLGTEYTWIKSSRCHEAEDLHLPIFRLRREAQKQIERLHRLIYNNRENILHPKSNKNQFCPLLLGEKTKLATFDDFLIDQCQDFIDGTQSNIIVDQHLRRLEGEQNIFLKQLISMLQELQNILIISLNNHNQNGKETHLDLFLKMMETVKNLLAPDSSNTITATLSVQDFVKSIEHIKGYFLNQGQKCQLNNQNLSQNWHIKAKNVTKRMAKIVKHSKYISELKKLVSSSSNEVERVQAIKTFEMNQVKINLSNLIKSFIQTENAKTQVCLNCENKITLNQMNQHIKACKTIYSCYERIEKLDALLNGRLQDLQSLSVSIKKMRSQKRKEFEFKQKSSKPNPFNKFSKSLYDKRNQSEYLKALSRKISEDQLDIRPFEEMSMVCLDDLSLDDLNKYLEIVEDLKRFILRIKNHKKQSLNSCIYTQIKQFKTGLRDNHDHLESTDILEIINLVISKFKTLRKIQEMETKIKLRPDRTFPRFQRQYEHLDSIKSESIAQERLTENDAYSDDESMTSSRNLDNKVSLKDFKIIRQLAQGKYGKVYLVKKIQTGVKYAMKRIELSNMQCKKEQQKLTNQNTAFSMIDNDYLVKAIFSFSEGKYHYFVMQYASNGDFADKLTEEQRLFEYQAKPVLAQIAVAINSLHQLGIIHRDIKPQNIVIDSEGHLKLTDFGLSETTQLKKKKLQEKSKTFSKFLKEQITEKQTARQAPHRVEKIVGSPYYMAPEVVSFEPVTKMSDWWSFGIIVYQTLVGEPPFIGKNFTEIAEKIEKGNIWWTKQIMFGEEDNMISYEAKDLIDQLLTANPEKRLGHNFKDIMQHKFFSGLDWQNLRNEVSPISFYEEEEQRDEEEDLKDSFMEEETSSYISANSSLKLIRRDVLTKQTKISYYKHLGVMIRLRKTAQRLINEATLQ